MARWNHRSAVGSRRMASFRSRSACSYCLSVMRTRARVSSRSPVRPTSRVAPGDQVECLLGRSRLRGKNPRVVVERHHVPRVGREHLLVILARPWRGPAARARNSARFMSKHRGVRLLLEALVNPPQDRGRLLIGDAARADRRQPRRGPHPRRDELAEPLHSREAIRRPAVDRQDPDDPDDRFRPAGDERAVPLHRGVGDRPARRRAANLRHAAPVRRAVPPRDPERVRWSPAFGSAFWA